MPRATSRTHRESRPLQASDFKQTLFVCAEDEDELWGDEPSLFITGSPEHGQLVARYRLEKVGRVKTRVVFDDESNVEEEG